MFFNIKVIIISVILSIVNKEQLFITKNKEEFLWQIFLKNPLV